METYALTTTTYQRRALFVRTANAELLVKTLFHYRDQGRYQLHGFAIMPEHLHVLLTSSANQTIERGVAFPMRCARNLPEKSGNPASTSIGFATEKIIGDNSNISRPILCGGGSPIILLFTHDS